VEAETAALDKTDEVAGVSSARQWRYCRCCNVHPCHFVRFWPVLSWLQSTLIGQLVPARCTECNSPCIRSQFTNETTPL